MALTFSEKGSDNSKFLAPSGSHIGLCDMVIYLGIQPGNGKFPDPKPKLLVRWELPHEVVEWEKDGVKHKGPKTVTKFYTASMGKKANLRKDLEGWRGKAFGEGEAGSFDIKAILGKACMLNIVHSPGAENTYANVASISGVPKGTQVPSFALKPLYYGPDDTTLFDELPPGIQKMIENQIVIEPKEVESANGVDFNPGFEAQEDDSDSVPF